MPQQKSRVSLILLVFALSLGCIYGIEDHYPTMKVGSRIYTNVTITSVTAAQVIVAHSRGMASIRIDDLEPELREKYAKATIEKQGLKTGSRRQGKAADQGNVLPSRPTEHSPSREDGWKDTSVITNSALNYSIAVSNAYILSTEEKNAAQGELAVFGRANHLPNTANIIIADAWTTGGSGPDDPLFDFALVSFADEIAPVQLANLSMEPLRTFSAFKNSSVSEGRFGSTAIKLVRMNVANGNEETLAMYAFLPLKPKAVGLIVMGSSDHEKQTRAALDDALANLHATVSTKQPVVWFTDRSISHTGWRAIGWWSSAMLGIIVVFVLLWKWFLRG